MSNVLSEMCPIATCGAMHMCVLGVFLQLKYAFPCMVLFHFLIKCTATLTQTWLLYLVDSPKIKWLLMAGGYNEALSLNNGFKKATLY